MLGLHEVKAAGGLHDGHCFCHLWACCHDSARGTSSAIFDFVMMGLQEVKAAGGLHELSLLATLIKPNTTKASNFKLNLFGDTTQPAQTSGGKSCGIACG